MPLRIRKGSDIEGLLFGIRIVQGLNLLPPNGFLILPFWAVAKRFVKNKKFEQE